MRKVKIAVLNILFLAAFGFLFYLWLSLTTIFTGSYQDSFHSIGAMIFSFVAAYALSYGHLYKANVSVRWFFLVIV